LFHADSVGGNWKSYPSLTSLTQFSIRWQTLSFLLTVF
jgi:hypothetical protein